MGDEIQITEREKRALVKLIKTGDSPESDLDYLSSLVDKGFLRCEKSASDSLRQSGPSFDYSWFSTKKGQKLIDRVKKEIKDG